MINSKEKEIIQLLQKSQTIGLLTHKNGDGDAFGAMLAFGRIMEAQGKDITYFSNEELPQIFDFLKEKIKYKPTGVFKEIDLLVGFDANELIRFSVPEVIEQVITAKTNLIIIDHHVGNMLQKDATIYWDETSEVSCTSEMIYDLLIEMKCEIDKVTANLLLVGIETDTFSLQFTNTKPKTFEVVADLLKRGARLKSVVESAFGGRPISTMKLFGRTIKRMKMDQTNGYVTSYITKDDTKELNLTTESSSGVANFLEQLDGTKVIAIFEERDEGIVKVSLRSNNSTSNVERLAKALGGGGHKKASGLEYKGTLKEAMAAVEGALPKP
jgi:phosphoesterase RecJ-like protein